MITKKRTKEQLLSEEVLDAYINRPDFQYDANGDALYRHYKDRYTQLGQTAMQDTVGQAAALTGGYGSSYAQNVGQQAYQGYMQQLGDVVPALYRLAYDRYRDKGETLYKTYQSLADQEQETARRAQQDRTYALALKKYELEEQKDPEAAYHNQQSTEPQGDYYAWLAYHTGQGSLSDSTVTETHAYDNGNVSEGNVKTMQRVLGFKETGQWTQQNQTDAGGVTADQAWAAYQTGQLTNYKSVGVGLPIGNIKTMERILGLEEDGYWSAEDQKAAGGLTAHAAWEDYQKGRLQSRSRSGMTTDAWAAHQSKQSRSSVTSENTQAVQDFIATTVTEDQAAERGINATEWKMTVMDRLNRLSLTAEEFAQLEKYYGLNIPGADAATPQDHTDQKLSYAQYRNKTATQKASDMNSAVQQYYNLCQAFINSAIYDMQYVDYNNAAPMLENRKKTAKDLNKQADALRSSLRINADIFSGECSEIIDQIVAIQTGIGNVMDFYDRQAKYYSQWATEDEYQKAKEYYDNWGHYLEADDFAYYSEQGAAIPNPSVAEAEGYAYIFGWRPGAKEVGNIVTYSRDNYERIAAISEGSRYDAVGDLRYKNMTEDEVAIYNYLLAKKGKEKAGEFLSYIEETLNAREGKRIAQIMTSIDIPVLEELALGMYGFGAGVDQWVGGMKQLFVSEKQPTSITQYANSEIASNLTGIGKYAYQTTNAIGNMAPTILLSSVTAGMGAPAAVAQGVGAATVGMSAAGNAYGSALREGDSAGQARAYSTLVGAAEGTLQYILGGIGSLGGVTDDLIKAKINMIDNSLLRIGAKLGVDVLSEISEEELQNFLEPAFRSIIFGEEYDAPTIDEMIETAIVTAGTTILLGGSGTVSSDLAANKLLNATAQMTNDQTNTPYNQEDIAKRLMNKGFNPKKSADMAEVIAARLNGQELTRTQTGRLRAAMDNAVVRDVMYDITKEKAEGIDSAQNNGYDKDNVDSGLETREEAALWDSAYQSVDAFGNHDYATVTEDSVPYQDRNAFSEGIRVVGTDTVTYRRVQGGSGNNASQVRIKVNADGSSSIPNKEANLSISIDGGEHAQYFLNKRGGDAQIIEIDVPKWFDDFLQENAIPQVNYKTNPRNQGGAAPKITDITTPGNCFELPAPWIEWLEEYGRNARIVNP